MKSDLVDLVCELRHETDKAWLLDFGDGKSQWIPKSQGEFDEADDGKNGVVTIPTWLAKEKELI